MRIGKNETILGYKMTLIRDLLRRISSRIWTDEDIAAHFHIPLDRAEQLTDALIRRGLLALKPDAEGNERDLVVTDLGQRLCAARFLKPIPRSRADAIIADTLVRVEAVNAREELVYRIAEVHVFGSYFRGEAEMSDIDLAVRLAPRRPGSKWIEESMLRGLMSGQVSLTSSRMLLFGTVEVLKLLRGGARHLRFTPWGLFEELGEASRRIYPLSSEGDVGSGTGTGQGEVGGPIRSTGRRARRGGASRRRLPRTAPSIPHNPTPFAPSEPVPLRPAA